MHRATSRLVHRFAIATAISVVVLTSVGQASLSPSEATRKGRTFLVSLLDPELGLLPEYRGATVYWLFHDNYLVAKVLNVSHPAIAQIIRSAIAREGVYQSGKIELLFGEAEKPFTFHQFELRDVRRTPNKLIR